jgi:hypothetical protein
LTPLVEASTAQREREAVPRSAVDDGHVPFVVTLARGRREVVQPLDLRGAQLDAVGGGVLLDTGDPLCPSKRDDKRSRLGIKTRIGSATSAGLKGSSSDAPKNSAERRHHNAVGSHADNVSQPSIRADRQPTVSLRR